MQKAYAFKNSSTASLGVAACLLALPYASGKLAEWRVFGEAMAMPWHATPGADVAPALVATSLPESVVPSLMSGPSAVLSAAVPAVAAAPGKEGVVAIEQNTAMSAFYASMAKTLAKEPHAITRILHYGDSTIAADYTTRTVRRMLQEKYGDAGHGFLLIGKPWPGYEHADVHYSEAYDGWKVARLGGPTAKNSKHGLGGVAYRGGEGTTSHFGTALHGTLGAKASRMELFYELEAESGGSVEVARQGGATETFSTHKEGNAIGVYSTEFADGAAAFKLTTHGAPKIYGAVLEREGPGFVYDALGIVGGRMRHFGEQDGAHWAEAVKLRKSALVIIQFGANEAEAETMQDDEYANAVRSVIDKIRSAGDAAHLSVMLAAPMDRGEARTDGSVRSLPGISRVIEVQRRIAKEKNCAFWDTRAAMGGDGAIGRWAKRGLAGDDYVHPTPKGASMLGGYFYEALIAGYIDWRGSHLAAPAP